MSRIINDTLFIARLEAGALELELKPMSVRATVQRTLAGFKAVTEPKGIKVRTRAWQKRSTCAGR